MIQSIIEREEGFRTHPYLCTEGYVTIGYGTKLFKHKGADPDDFSLVVTKDAAYMLLEARVGHIKSSLYAGPHRETILAMSSNRIDILISMAYQMGLSGLYNFTNMWAAAENRDYGEMANQMLDSTWARQTPERAQRHAYAVRYNDLNEYQ